jgi:hypothetical protein
MVTGTHAALCHGNAALTQENLNKLPLDETADYARGGAFSQVMPAL